MEVCKGVAVRRRLEVDGSCCGGSGASARIWATIEGRDLNGRQTTSKGHHKKKRREDEREASAQS
jgi:hypothetical protein